MNICAPAKALQKLSPSRKTTFQSTDTIITEKEMTTTYQTFGRNPNFDRDWLEKDLIDEIRPWLN